MDKLVYLAGPITGLTEGAANDWREMVIDALKDYDIKGISPLRQESVQDDGVYGAFPISAIGAKNKYDTKSCGITLAYLPAPDLLPPEFEMGGTLVEIGMAFAWDKIVVTVTDHSRWLECPLINVASGWIVPSLGDAVEVIGEIYGGY